MIYTYLLLPLHEQLRAAVFRHRLRMVVGVGERGTSQGQQAQQSAFPAGHLADGCGKLDGRLTRYRAYIEEAAVEAELAALRRASQSDQAPSCQIGVRENIRKLALDRCRTCSSRSQRWNWRSTGADGARRAPRLRPRPHPIPPRRRADFPFSSPLAKRLLRNCRRCSFLWFFSLRLSQKSFFCMPEQRSA